IFSYENIKLYNSVEKFLGTVRFGNGPCEMTSVHLSSGLVRQCQMVSAENNTSGPAPFLNVQKTFDRSRSSLGLHGDDF
ncbi:hypothetical protein Tco_1189091, partial [Tanacetum coccineum]